MPQLREICEYLNNFAPTSLAEEWDNVGLLVGDREREISSIMTCLTVTPETVDEAIAEDVDLIVTHHPMPFRPVKRITTDDTVGQILYALISKNTAVYSPHTSFDSTVGGINQQLAEGLSLKNVKPIRPSLENQEIGSGRYGELTTPLPMESFASRIKGLLSVPGLHVVGEPNRTVSKIGVACGSAGEFLADAKKLGCDALLVGETSFHTCLDAEASGVCLFLPGHYASERFAVENLASRLQNAFQELKIWASRDEKDPLRWF